MVSMRAWNRRRATSSESTREPGPLVTFETITGTLFIAVVIARLVGVTTPQCTRGGRLYPQQINGSCRGIARI